MHQRHAGSLCLRETQRTTIVQHLQGYKSNYFECSNNCTHVSAGLCFLLHTSRCRPVHKDDKQLKSNQYPPFRLGQILSSRRQDIQTCCQQSVLQWTSTMPSCKGATCLQLCTYCGCFVATCLCPDYPQAQAILNGRPCLIAAMQPSVMPLAQCLDNSIQTKTQSLPAACKFSTQICHWMMSSQKGQHGSRR